MLAVRFSIVQPADAAPNRALYTLLRPDAPPIRGAALAADQDAGQGVLGAVFSKAGGGTLFRTGGGSVPAGGFLLDGIENLPADDGLMVVLYQDLWELAGVFDDLLADAVLDEGLLQENIAAVFLIP